MDQPAIGIVDAFLLSPEHSDGASELLFRVHVDSKAQILR